MYVFRARYACPSPRTELDGEPGDMALVVEQVLGLALWECVGVVILERVHISAHRAGSCPAFTVHLEVRSPDRGTHIQRASQGEAQQAIEVIVLRLLRELFGPVLTEAAELAYEACDADWGEAARARSRRR